MPARSILHSSAPPGEPIRFRVLLTSTRQPDLAATRDVPAAAAPVTLPLSPAPSLLPDRLPMPRHLDPIAALAFRTPLQEHVLSADGKAAGVLTLLGLMFTVLTRLGGTLSDVIQGGGVNVWFKVLCLGLLGIFAGGALATVIQAFRTISPRFPKAEPSLAFFGDIARLSRDEYLARVRALTPEQAVQQMLSFNHTAATIVVNKFAQLALALRCFRLASVCWAMLIAILAHRAFNA